MKQIVDKYPELEGAVKHANDQKRHYKPRHPIIATKANEELFSKISSQVNVVLDQEDLWLKQNAAIKRSLKIKQDYVKKITNRLNILQRDKLIAAQKMHSQKLDTMKFKHDQLSNTEKAMLSQSYTDQVRSQLDFDEYKKKLIRPRDTFIEQAEELQIKKGILITQGKLHDLCQTEVYEENINDINAEDIWK